VGAYQIDSEFASLDYLELIPASAGYFARENGIYRALYVNQALISLLGRSGDELARMLSAETLDFLHPEDAERISMTLYKAGVSGGKFREIVRVQVKDKTWKWTEITLNAEPQIGGGCVLAFLLSDVNVRMERQQRLNSTFAHLLDIMNNTPGGIVVFETLNNRISGLSFASQGMERLLRGTREEIRAAYKNDPYGCVHPDDRSNLIHTIEDALRNLSGFRMDLRLRTITDGYIWVSVSATIDNTGDQRVVYVALVDISADADYLHQQKQILDVFVRKQYEHICSIDGKHGGYRVLNSNQYTGPFLDEEGTDFEKDFTALIRKNVAQAEREQFAKLFRIKAMLDCLETNGDVEYYCTIITEEEKPRYKKVWLSWIDRETKMIALVSSDVTDEHHRAQESREALLAALQAAEQANSAKSEFLSRMSHDIRTPLNAIIGYTEMCLESDELCPQLRDYLSKADSSSKFLLSLINDILNMSRIESGKLALKEALFTLPVFLDSISAVVASQCAAKRIRYSCTVDGRTERAYIGDQLKLQQVLLNIVGNSVKFTPEGGEISLTVGTMPNSEPPQLLFTVKDTGCGISPAFLPHIFDPFAQEKQSLNSEIKGTGLGLAICRSLVSMMGGSIHVDSALGKGSMFRISLPLRAESSGEAINSDARSAESGGWAEESWNFDGQRVLVAEDNELNLEIARHVLEKANIRVDAARTGREALALFEASEKSAYAAILMDIRMPEMDGLETTRRIRNLERADAGIPIIAMSANAFEEDIREALGCGMNAYTIKPISISQLYSTLRQFIK